MDRVEVQRECMDWWIGKVCDGLDARRKEWESIRARGPVLALAAFMCLCGVSAIVQGKDGDLVRRFGELVAVVAFVGTPGFAGWFIRDRLRLGDIAREDTAATADLERRGYEYDQGVRPRLYRLAQHSQD